MTQSGFNNLQISSGEVLPTTLGIRGAERQTQTLENNQWVQVTIPAITTGVVGVAVMLRVGGSPSAFTGYAFEAINLPGTLSSWILREDGGTETTLVEESSTTWASGDILRATVVEDVLTLYRCTPSCTAILSATDDTYTSGSAGMWIYSDTSLLNGRIDDYASGNMGPLYVQNQAGLTYAPGALSSSTQYYWKITARNSVATTPGPIISFTTSAGVPACASNLSPIDAASSVALTPTLSWDTVATATAYDVYFDAVNGTTLVSNNQVGLTYDPGTISAGTQYFWKIIPSNAAGDATGCTAISFTTAAASAGVGGKRLRR
jgi:hypothetical protein